jgi:hypothetical protein
MRNNHNHNQNKRMRGRNRGGGGKGHNPLTRVYESNGPDVKIRGTANHVAEKYIQLARDAQASGDPVAAENYYQHAEHYFRLIAAAQEQFRQSQPFQQHQQPAGEQTQQPRQDDNFDDGDDDAPQGGEPFSPREQQPYPQQGQQNNQQPYPPRDYQQGNQRQHHDNRPQHGSDNGGDLGRLPSFITGSQPQQGQPQQPGYGQNNNGYDNQGDRFPLHRRRRRGHRGPRPDMQGGAQGNEGGDDMPPSGPTPAGE